MKRIGLFLVYFSILLSTIYCDEVQDKFFDSVFNQDVDGIKNAVAQGANPNQQNEYGMPPIAYAASVDNAAIVKLLLDYKVDINTQNNEGATALHYVIGMKHNDLIDILLQNGANVNIVDRYNQSPLFIAAMTGNEYAASKIIKSTKDINSRNSNDFTPLMIAAQNNNINVIKILLDNKVNIEDVRKRGGTALSFAADKENIDIVKLLLENGANINAQDLEMGITPLMNCAYMNKVNTVDFLLKNSADKSIKDKSGKTALDYAKMRKNKKIIILLEE